MLAVVKAPHTKRPTLEIRGRIPSWMLKRLKKEYGRNCIIKDDSETLVDVFKTDWYKSIDARMKPCDSIKIYRENKGMSQAELGEKLGNVPRQNISSMEKGRRGVSKEMAKQLSRILNAPIERFI
jgi:DNA-binding XRE family transcriptional regulator